MTQAIILAGGFGTRLRSVISEIPKPMAPINDKPFLAYLLEEISQQELIQEVIFSVHYKRESISEYFGNSYKNLSLKYAIEERPLGTGGAIKTCAHMIQERSPFFIFNGDSLLQFSHQQMYTSHLKQKSPITLAAKKMAHCNRYGRLILNETNQILSFESSGSESEGYINAGVYLLNPNLIEKLPPAPSSFEKDFLQMQLKTLSPNIFFSSGYFIDIGIPEDYVRAKRDFCELAYYK